MTAARKILEEKGPEAVTLREVAARAGVSHAAPYHHFADKDALLAAVATEAFYDFEAALGAARGSTPMQRLRGMGIVYVRFALERPAIFRLMFGPDRPDKAKHPELAAAAISAFTKLNEAAAAAAGDSVDPELLTVTAWCIVHGFSTLWIDGAMQPLVGSRRDPEKLAKAVLELCNAIV